MKQNCKYSEHVICARVYDLVDEVSSRSLCLSCKPDGVCACEDVVGLTLFEYRDFGHGPHQKKPREYPVHHVHVSILDLFEELRCRDGLLLLVHSAGSFADLRFGLVFFFF